MVGWNRYCGHGDYNFAFIEGWWNAVVKMEGPDSTEKISLELLK